VSSQRLKNLTRPSPDWGPALPQYNEKYQALMNGEKTITELKQQQMDISMMEKQPLNC
jgi:hypothetical protein